MDFSDSIGLLIFLLFLFLQFIASLFGRKTKGKRPPQPSDRERSGGEVTLEDALREIQEALGGAPPRTEPTPDDQPVARTRDGEEAPPYVDYVPASPPTVRPGPAPSDEHLLDEEESLAFQHFDDFEAHGEAHFDSGAHEQFERARAEREAMFDSPLKTDRPTLMERTVAQDALRGQRALSEIEAPQAYTGRARTEARAPTTDSLDRLRRKLRSPEAVQDAYRLHVILGEPRSKRRSKQRR